MFNLFRTICLITLILSHSSAYASVILEELPLDNKCYFIKGYKNTTTSNATFMKSLRRISQLEALISSIVLLENPNDEICKVDNENYSKVEEELIEHDANIYSAIRENIATISKTKEKKNLISERVVLLEDRLDDANERITDLNNLRRAILSGSIPLTVVTGVNNSDINEVLAELWIAERYKAELENRLVLWNDLKKRLGVKDEE